MSKANDSTAAACQAGDADACSLLGTSLYLEARASETSLEPSVRAFVTACDRGDWHGCGMAAFVKAALKQDARPTAAKAFPMAMAACRDGKGAGCIYVADWAAKAGDRITAAVHYRTACELNLEATGARAMDEYSCRKAVEFGTARADLLTKAAPVGEDPHPEFRRVQGEKNILPPRNEAWGMCKAGLTQVTARLCLCVSETGVPTKIMFAEFSGAREWDRRLFETMRSWRYTPYVGQSGKPEPVCTGVTFHYPPKC